MTTISSLANNTYTMYKMASGNNASTTSANSNLVSAFSSAYGPQKKTNAAQDSLTNLWSNYTNSTSSSASLSGISTIYGISSSATELVNSYNEARKTYETEFSSTMDDLKKSAGTVAKLDFTKLSQDDIKTAEDGTKTYSDALKGAIKDIKQLVSDYNDALGTTNDYSSVSKRMKSLATTFADTTYRADSYQQVGISVDSKTGELSVDEDKLAKALTENGSRVENALGKNGLAGKASHHADFALAQQDKAFPSMKNMLGNQLSLASAYTNPKVLTANVQYSMIGNLLNMAW